MPRFTNDSGHDEKLIVVALFSEEICDAIDKFRHTAEGKTAFDSLISRNDLQTIKAEPDDTIYAHKVFNAALDSPLRNVLYNEVQRFLKIVDPKLHLVIENYTVYDRYLAHIPYLMRFVETTNLDELVSKCAGFKECLQPLQMSLAAKIIDNERFKKCFLRSVPEIGGAAVEHLFMHLFKYGSPEAKEFVELVNPNFDFERYYSWRHAAESSEQQPGAILFVDETASSEAIFSMESQSQITLLDMNTHLKTSHPLSVINWDKFTPETPVAIRPEHFDLRPYQEELAHHALKGENTIIWAPTGSGKTIVAVHVIAQHLLKGNGRKVCFVVPNVTLLEQQKRVCERHMDAKVNIIKAESKAPFSGMVAASHIVLLTPQMLVNALQNTTEGKENFSLSVFSMIVLDECHHTAESHPYNVLMHHYHDVKLKGTGKSPQIVGLTASLGAGTSRNANEAFRHIQKLCANLDSPKISTVEKHKADLTGFAVETKDRIRYVESNYRSKPFFKDVMELMSELENGIFVHPAIACDPVKKAMIKEQVCRSSDASSTANYRSSASTRYSQAYQNWLGNALMITLPKVDLPSDARVEIMTRFRLLKILYKMIELWANFNGKCAMDYYMKESEGLPIPLPVHDRIRELVSYRNDNSDMLIEMCQLLVEKFGEGTDGASPARVLIFVKEREYTYMLANIIDCCNELKALGVRPDFLISTNSGDGECRLNPEEQRSKLEKFRSGEINLLCSTSVAEEGLDVAECNLVIKYNYASSDIAHVQRRGRARHQNSYAVLFTHDKNLEQQENKNILSEELSNQAIALLRQMPQKMFEAEVQELVRKSYSDRVIERAAKETASLALKDVGARYDILCRTCTEFIGRSTDVRHSNHSLHILCDGSIWDRFTCEESVSQENFLKTSELPIGKIYCNNCKEVWGRIVIFKGIAVPIIACKGILLQNARGERFPCAKWAGIKGRYFCPEEVKSVDLARLSAAPHRPQFLTVLMGETESRSL